MWMAVFSLCSEQSLPCVKGGGICEANDGGIVKAYSVL